MKNTRLSKGFTLIELLIVITIIGILAVALLPSVLGAPARARDAARKADLNNIIAAIETYNSDNQSYPTGAAICFDGTANALDSYFQGAKAPNDPQGKGLSGDTSGACDGYYYCPLDGNPASYALGAYMEMEGDGTTAAGSLTTSAGCDGTDDLVAEVPKTADDHIFMIVK